MSTGARTAALLALELRDFRGYEHLSIEPAAGLNVLYGPNGSGKTNLLEAIGFLSVARSTRTSVDAELIRHGAPALEVVARHTVLGLPGDPPSRPSTLRIRYQTRAGRTAAVDERRVARIGEIYGRLPSVTFSPDDLWLLKGSPSGRRLLLDRLLVQASSLYGESLMAYRRVLGQRNATLQEIRARRASKSLLALWDAQLIQYGWDIARHRGELVAQLGDVARAGYRRLTGGAEVLECRYVSGAAIDEAHKVEEASESRWKARFEEALAERASRDVATGATGSGPHRDDVVMLVGGRVAGRFASQGQQRTVVLSLKLAERASLARRLGCLPLLLVDDVLSELDLGRRDALHEILLGEGQVFLTATDAETERMPQTGSRFQIDAGKVLPVPRPG